MPFQDNTTQNAQNTDVGFKISKPGYDAHKTAGNNLVFSSSWPSLPIAFEKTINNPVTGLGATGTVNHNLQFPPLTFVWAYGPDPSGIGMAARRIVGIAGVDKNTVYLADTGLSGIETDFLYTATKLHIKCFQLDLSADLDYILAPGDTFNGGYDPNFGVKVALPGKSITSRDLRDFAVHSRAQSPLIQAVKNETTANAANPSTVQFTSKYKYPVWVYGYTKSSAGRYRFAAYGGQAYPITFTDGFVTNLTFSGGAGDNGATLVILRDPMFAPNQVITTY